MEKTSLIDLADYRRHRRQPNSRKYNHEKHFNELRAEISRLLSLRQTNSVTQAVDRAMYNLGLVD